MYGSTSCFFYIIYIIHVYPDPYNYTSLLLMAKYDSIIQLSHSVFNHFPIDGILTIFRNLLFSNYI